MSPILRASLLLGVISVSSAKADDTGIQQSIVGGSVNGVCGISRISVPPQSSITSISTDGGMAIVFNSFINPQDSTPLALNLQVNIEATCNQAHSIDVSSQSGGMILNGPIAETNGFSSRRDYLTRLNWGSFSGEFQTNGNPQNAINLQIGGAIRDVMTISLSAPASNNPLVAGSYSDIIFVNLHGAP